LSTLRNARTTRLDSGRAHRTQTAPGSLGELDWIVMKALEKDRNRRYESAGALARHIERHLPDEPVHACPPSNWYVLHKCARRNKTAIATASVVGVAVLLALGALTASTIVIGHQQQLTANALQNETNALQNEIRAKDDLQQALERERREVYFQR